MSVEYTTELNWAFNKHHGFRFISFFFAFSRTTQNIDGIICNAKLHMCKTLHLPAVQTLGAVPWGKLILKHKGKHAKDSI